MKFGFGELLVIFVIALLVLGPDQLPIYTRKLGAALREFRDATSEATKDIRENVIEPLNEAQKPLREALEPLEELQSDITKDVKDVEKSFKSATAVPAAKKTAGKKKAKEESAEASGVTGEEEASGEPETAAVEEEASGEPETVSADVEQEAKIPTEPAGSDKAQDPGAGGETVQPEETAVPEPAEDVPVGEKANL